MVAEEVGFLASFLAGALSFLSPCVIPLVPAYLSMITGLTVEELEDGRTSMGRVVLSILLFILGFSLVFIIMGATASAAGRFLATYRRSINLLLGFVVIFMGLFISGLFRLPRLYSEKRLHLTRDFLLRLGPLAAMAMGSAFALGWTPCVGPILSSILAYAASTSSLTKGVALLSLYSLGLGLPFLLVGVSYTRALTALTWFRRNQGRVNAVAGALLVILGILLVLDELELLLIWL